MIVLAVLALTALGLLVVYSSSAMDGYLGGTSFEDTFRTLGPQLQWAAVGLVGMLLAMRLDFRWLRLASLPLLVGAGILLVLLQVESFQVTIGGSSQWLRLPGLPAVQPSELAKLALVIYLAHWMARRGSAVGGLTTGLLPFVVIVAPFVLLVFKSPDIGSAAILGLTAVVMFFLAGANPLYLAGLAAARRRGRPRLPEGLPAGAPAVVRRPLRRPARDGLPRGPGPAGPRPRRPLRVRPRRTRGGRAGSSSPTPTTTTSSR